MAAALGHLHRDPARPWTVASLAATVGMSRSALAARFTALVGRAPMEYLQHWRMQLAATALCEERRSIAEIALDVGYESEVSFSRAFKREMGMAPGAYRRRHREFLTRQAVVESPIAM
jgi:AraC-like DNA-binding protein